MTREEFVAYIKAEVSKGADAIKQIAKDIEDNASDVRQVFFRVGHTRGKDDAKAELDTIKTERDAAVGERDQLKTEVETLRKGNQQTSDLIREHDNKMRDAADKHKRELKAKDDDIRSLRMEVSKADWIRGATDKTGKGGGMKEIYAENLFDKLVRAGRIKWDDKGKVSLYEVDGATPYPTPSATDETWWHVMAKDERRRAPDDMLDVKSDKGSDTQRLAGGGGGGGSNRYDELRKEEEARTKAREGTTKSAEERMGVRG